MILNQFFSGLGPLLGILNEICVLGINICTQQTLGINLSLLCWELIDRWGRETNLQIRIIFVKYSKPLIMVCDVTIVFVL